MIRIAVSTLGLLLSQIANTLMLPSPDVVNVKTQGVRDSCACDFMCVRIYMNQTQTQRTSMHFGINERSEHYNVCKSRVGHVLGMLFGAGIIAYTSHVD